MYELDHMLNGNGSRQHHKDIIQAVQRERLARLVDANGDTLAGNTPKRVRQIRTALAGVMQTITG